jgi:hypothetical protein
MSIFRDPAKRAEFVFGQPMKPCPKCGSYSLIHQTPIKMAEPITAGDSAKQAVGKWAREMSRGDPQMEGPVFIMCRDCFHKGPSMDCTGMTRSQVGQSREVSDTVKRLWNDQPQPA